MGAGEDQDDNLFVHAWHTDVPVDSDLSFLTILQYNTQHDGVYTPPNSSGVENGNTDVSHALLLQCTPNPCSGMASIFVSGALPGQLITITVWDLTGRLIRNFATAACDSRGMASTGWDGRTISGELSPSGIYCVTVSSGETITASQMITLLR